MESVRVLRHDDALRVLFTSKTGLNKFEIIPAGEEDKGEDPVRIKEITYKKNVDSVKISDYTVVVNSKAGKRVSLDLQIDKSQYTGYGIVEYRTRRKSK